MIKKKSKNKKCYQDSNSIAIIGLLLTIASIYVEQYLDFSYIFALSFENDTLISIVYLLLGFSGLAFWTMSLGFIMAIRFNILINNFFNYHSLSASKDRKFKLFKAQNYSYLVIFSLFLCFIIIHRLRPSNYIFLKDHLISLL